MADNIGPGLVSRGLRLVRGRGGKSNRYQPNPGLSVPIVTALDRDGRILEHDQRAIVRWAVQDGAGANIIFAAGTTGEWDRLDNARRQRVAAIVVDECRRIRVSGVGVEAWVGVTAHTRAETMENVRFALELGADAAVIAPLSVRDSEDPVELVNRDLANLFEREGRAMPVFLYDNADIAAPNRAPHLHTRDVKEMSRMEFVRGVKVTAGKAVLGNYTRAASHFARNGAFAIYAGNPYLIFDLFEPPEGVKGYAHHYWNRYWTRNSLPYGIVAGPANVLPREWQRAWQVCKRHDAMLMTRCATILEEFREICESFRVGQRPATIACFKTALAEIGVCESDALAPGTPSLDAAARREFIRRFKQLRWRSAATLEPGWLSEIEESEPLSRARQDA